MSAFDGQVWQGLTFQVSAIASSVPVGCAALGACALLLWGVATGRMRRTIASGAVAAMVSGWVLAFALADKLRDPVFRRAASIATCLHTPACVLPVPPRYVPR